VYYYNDTINLYNNIILRARSYSIYYNNKHLPMITIAGDERVRTSGCLLYSTCEILLSDEKKPSQSQPSRVKYDYSSKETPYFYMFIIYFIAYIILLLLLLLYWPDIFRAVEQNTFNINIIQTIQGHRASSFLQILFPMRFDMFWDASKFYLWPFCLKLRNIRRS